MEPNLYGSIFILNSFVLQLLSESISHASRCMMISCNVMVKITFYDSAFSIQHDISPEV